MVGETKLFCVDKTNKVKEEIRLEVEGENFEGGEEVDWQYFEEELAQNSYEEVDMQKEEVGEEENEILLPIGKRLGITTSPPGVSTRKFS